jgi:hypothetical protein
VTVRVATGNFLRKQQRRAAGRARWAIKVADEGVRDLRHGVRRPLERGRDRAVTAVKAVLRRVRRPIHAGLRRRTQLAERWGFYRTEWGIDRELEAIARDGRPILAGPWLSEVGFETLYWVPFLHWFRAAYRLPPERLIAVSRGGAEAWYADVAARYADAWDDLTPEEFARRNAARGETKQLGLSALDREVVAAATRRLGLSAADVVVLHPSLMYRLFALYWSGQRAMGFVDARTRFTRLAPPAVIDPGLLPREYVAVKLYAARSLPDTPETRARLRALMATAAARMPVVLLDTGLVLDEHEDYGIDGAEVTSARPWMTPRNNLAVQTQIIAGARRFIGTCGSLTWLAPRLGVDTAALYVNPEWLHAHLPVAMRAYHRLGAGRFLPADLRALDLP